METVQYFFIAGVVAATAVILAQRKNRNLTVWCTACFLLPILILPLIALPPLTSGDEQRPPGDKIDSERSDADC